MAVRFFGVFLVLFVAGGGGHALTAVLERKGPAVPATREGTSRVWIDGRWMTGTVREVPYPPEEAIGRALREERLRPVGEIAWVRADTAVARAQGTEGGVCLIATRSDTGSRLEVLREAGTGDRPDRLVPLPEEGTVLFETARGPGRRLLLVLTGDGTASSFPGYETVLRAEGWERDADALPIPGGGSLRSYRKGNLRCRVAAEPSARGTVLTITVND